uniref:HIG1 domain-containing protein n=1 Tax=Anopheles merus TaxID=30066 RepID=A0A182VHQ2_ANOME
MEGIKWFKASPSLRCYPHVDTIRRQQTERAIDQMSGKVPSFDETHSDKLARKARESPFMPIGIAGLVAVCAIGAYKYKHRGAMSTSVFLMQLRVAAQGTVVAALSIGLGYTMANEYIFNKKDD